MTTLEIDAPKVLAAVFDSPKAKVALLRKLLLQSGLSLVDLFVCDKTTGRAVAKDKAQLKDGLIRKYCKGGRGTSKKCGGSSAAHSTAAAEAEDQRRAQAEAQRRAQAEGAAQHPQRGLVVRRRHVVPSRACAHSAIHMAHDAVLLLNVANERAPVGEPSQADPAAEVLGVELVPLPEGDEPVELAAVGPRRRVCEEGGITCCVPLLACVFPFRHV